MKPDAEVKRYALGFLISNDQVMLIRKSKPEWQRGLLNGIGGKIEAGEDGVHAMTREFYEEAGLFIDINRWMHFLTMEEVGIFSVEVFYAVGSMAGWESKTDEAVEIVSLDEIPRRCDLIENIPWIIALAIDCMTDGRPGFTHCSYGGPALAKRLEAALKAIEDAPHGHNCKLGRPNKLKTGTVDFPCTCWKSRALNKPTKPTP